MLYYVWQWKHLHKICLKVEKIAYLLSHMKWANTNLINKREASVM